MSPVSVHLAANAPPAPTPTSGESVSSPRWTPIQRLELGFPKGGLWTLRRS